MRLLDWHDTDFKVNLLCVLSQKWQGLCLGKNPAKFTSGTAWVCVRRVFGEIQMCVGNNRRKQSNTLILVNYPNSGIKDCLTLQIVVSQPH